MLTVNSLASFFHFGNTLRRLLSYNNLINVDTIHYYSEYNIYVDMNQREEKGKRITKDQIKRIDEDYYLVNSQSTDNKQYDVISILEILKV